MTRFRWGIFGTGAISAKFVAGLRAARGAEPAFVASRSMARARAFAAEAGIGRAHEDYAQAAAAGGVDAVYIATPPSEHVAHALMCIEAGLPVLVEKPLAANADEAARIADAARRKGVFAMEAMWTRFLPAAQALRDQVAAGSVGDIRLIAGNFGISYVPDPANGMFDPALGGGALAHLGPYPLSLGQWLFGTPVDVRAIGTIGRTGVDEDVSVQLRYLGGVIASFYVSLRAWAPDDFHVLGTEGMLALKGSIVRPFGLTTARAAPIAAEPAQLGWKGRLRQHGLVHRIAQQLGRSSRGRGKDSAHFYAGNGYHYEADEVRACLARGAAESAVMPLADSVAVAATIDRIRGAVRGQASAGEQRA